MHVKNRTVSRDIFSLLESCNYPLSLTDLEIQLGYNSEEIQFGLDCLAEENLVHVDFKDGEAIAKLTPVEEEYLEQQPTLWDQVLSFV